MTPYARFIDAFMEKVTEYKFLQYTDDELFTLAVKYMKAACLKFRKICKADLTQFDDSERVFLADIDDEVIDIVSDGMVVEWLKPYRNNADNLENILNTKDFTMYSSANLLAQTREALSEAEKHFIQRMREYSFDHGDLTSLHL
ncbi:hypothetical protein [Anaerotignum lactatifermentans]|jgi:hypothetical protein|uniref:hypothetical protein n=1 Tax=Anaerotignum lactatifermentans TaxID=160404 RepID=UPI00206D4D08|nr:MAG TPA: hypothetical protein [Caudoviricetes sp.]